MNIIDTIYFNSQSIREMERSMDSELDEIMSKFSKDTAPEEYEKVEAAVSAAASVAERKGFELGMKCFARLIIQCLS